VTRTDRVERLVRLRAAGIGIAATVAAWWLLARFWFPESLPEPQRVLTVLVDERDLLWRNTRTTLHEAALGWLWGNGIALALALVVGVVPSLERLALRIGLVVYCLPVLAIGPVLEVMFRGEGPKIAIAALSVFFTTFVGAVVGLRSADRTSLDLIRVAGGGRWSQLVKVRMRAATPSVFAALRIAAPAALLGAMLGEYLGGTRGLGILMINAQQTLELERTWAIAVVATVLAGVGYALTGWVGRRLSPWASAGAR
jgi:ABC-type nitrate/sulfonate/bicarbonate transport system permease component